ncbi:conserved hypothetical protein [Methylorubrum extorquens AM1]|uniref:Uncharacterized protein n=1 Tax=Methylorubrum extorquens (strain ATCC 14718 / DSM 1338 / JCM 2805 / NCIMB 9133 / AM1) TaxID=272630 RepID=C5ARN2_METEA|nr:conserved hypothetical protein [Methylorubrum extorquens AM1]
MDHATMATVGSGGTPSMSVIVAGDGGSITRLMYERRCRTFSTRLSRPRRLHGTTRVAARRR